MSLTVAELKAVYSVDEGPLDRSLKGVPGKVARVKPDGVKIDGDDRGFDRAATSAERRAGRLSQTMRSTVGAIAGYFAFDAVIGFIGDSISAASDLSETVNKSNVIFGRNADVVNDWAQDAARNMGLSRQAALNAAAGFGDMFSQIGFAGDEAARLSTQVVQMSADLGSFNNLGTEDVAERISAAFRGEYDSLQLLIPNINAARVESEALAMTGKDNAAALTAQEKAAAVLAIVQKDGARAMGDFARTSDGLANRQKTLAGLWMDQKAALGEQLLPVMSAVVGFISGSLIPFMAGLGSAIAGVVGFIADVPGPVLAAVAALTAMALLKGPLGTMLAHVQIGLGNLMIGAANAASGMGGLRSAASKTMGLFGGPWGAALAAAAAAYGLLSDGQEKFEKSARAAAVELASQVAVYGEAATSSAELGRRLAEEAGLFDGLAASRRGANEALEETGGVADFANDATGGMLDTLIGIADQFTGGELAARGFTDEIKNQADEMGAYEVQSEAASAAMKKLNDLVADGVTSGPEYEAAVRAAAEAQAEHEATSEAAAGAVDEYRAATDEAATAAEAQAEAVDALKSALDRFLGVAISAREAQLDVADSLADIAEAAAESGTSLDENTQAGRDNERMILDHITALGDLTEATLKETGSVEEARAAYEREMGALRRRLVEMGYSETAIDSLIARYGTIPEEEWTRILADATQAANAIAAVQAQLNALRDKHIRIITESVGVVRQANVQNAFRQLDRPRAEGGPVWPGQTFLVGEEGPELVRFSGHGTVIPADQTARLMAAGNAQASSGLSARVPTASPMPAATSAGSSVGGGGGRGALYEHHGPVNIIEGTPQDVARELEMGARTRGNW